MSMMKNGTLTEDAAERASQGERRLGKLFSLKQEISVPFLYGPERADTTLIDWGSTLGAIQEAVGILHKEGASANTLHLNGLRPLPAEAVADTLSTARNSYVIENNTTSQLARLIKAKTGRFVHAARRNHDITCLVHNNQGHGLTEGQASPTSDVGFITKTTPYGATDPIDPVAPVIFSGASFVGRSFA
jgi:pyruvate/2-oxoacid:ferredoxin oxidoreductase alpha subunit